ncbi:MAG: hypothetical protein FWH25_05245 [Syntrophorhabdaceae bacterium]|nr:hypothetical protein [Syntrophorhabdaceae bacterium]
MGDKKQRLGDFFYLKLLPSSVKVYESVHKNLLFLKIDVFTEILSQIRRSNFIHGVQKQGLLHFGLPPFSAPKGAEALARGHPRRGQKLSRFYLLPIRLHAAACLMTDLGL